MCIRDSYTRLCSCPRGQLVTIDIGGPVIYRDTTHSLESRVPAEVLRILRTGAKSYANLSRALRKILKAKFVQQLPYEMRLGCVLHVLTHGGRASDLLIGLHYGVARADLGRFCRTMSHVCLYLVKYDFVFYTRIRSRLEGDEPYCDERAN